METMLICQLYNPLDMRSQGLTFLIFKIGSKSSAREELPCLLFVAPHLFTVLVTSSESLLFAVSSEVLPGSQPALSLGALFTLWFW